MENIALIAHEMCEQSKANAAKQAKENNVVCLKAHYLAKFLAAQAAKKKAAYAARSATFAQLPNTSSFYGEVSFNNRGYTSKANLDDNL